MAVCGGNRTGLEGGRVVFYGWSRIQLDTVNNASLIKLLIKKEEKNISSEVISGNLEREIRNKQIWLVHTLF